MSVSLTTSVLGNGSLAEPKDVLSLEQLYYISSTALPAGYKGYKSSDFADEMWNGSFGLLPAPGGKLDFIDEISASQVVLVSDITFDPGYVIQDFALVFYHNGVEGFLLSVGDKFYITKTATGVVANGFSIDLPYRGPNHAYLLHPAFVITDLKYDAVNSLTGQAFPPGATLVTLGSGIVEVTFDCNSVEYLKNKYGGLKLPLTFPI